jgi:hypothetical protein
MVYAARRTPPLVRDAIAAAIVGVAVGAFAVSLALPEAGASGWLSAAFALALIGLFAALIYPMAPGQPNDAPRWLAFVGPAFLLIGIACAGIAIAAPPIALTQNEWRFIALAGLPAAHVFMSSRAPVGLPVRAGFGLLAVGAAAATFLTADHLYDGLKGDG